MIEEGKKIQEAAEKDLIFKLLFIFVSVLSYIRDIKTTVSLMVAFFLLKYAIKPLFKVTPIAAGDPSLDSKQPWLDIDVCQGDLLFCIHLLKQGTFPNLPRSTGNRKPSQFYLDIWIYNPRFQLFLHLSFD